MADVYKFKVKTFESTASHLFNIEFDGKRYEIVFEQEHIIHMLQTVKERDY